MIMDLKGVQDTLELYEDRVVIVSRNLLSKLNKGLTKGDKTIYIRNITGIEFRPGGALVNGYIQFTIAGGNERKGGTFGAVSDENSVLFMKKYNEIAEKVKLKIEEIQKSLEKPHNTISIADELSKFKTLLDSGVISEEEFDAKKKQLLSL